MRELFVLETELEHQLLELQLSDAVYPYKNSYNSTYKISPINVTPTSLEEQGISTTETQAIVNSLPEKPLIAIAQKVQYYLEPAQVEAKKLDGRIIDQELFQLLYGSAVRYEYSRELGLDSFQSFAQMYIFDPFGYSDVTKNLSGKLRDGIICLASECLNQSGLLRLPIQSKQDLIDSPQTQYYQIIKKPDSEDDTGSNLICTEAVLKEANEIGVQGLPKGYSHSSCTSMLPSFFKENGLVTPIYLQEKGAKVTTGEAISGLKETFTVNIYFAHPYRYGDIASVYRGGYCATDWFDVNDIIFVVPTERMKDLPKGFTLDSHNEYTVAGKIASQFISHVCVPQKNLELTRKQFAACSHIRVLSIEAIELARALNLNQGNLSI